MHVEINTNPVTIFGVQQNNKTHSQAPIRWTYSKYNRYCNRVNIPE